MATKTALPSVSGSTTQKACRELSARCTPPGKTSTTRWEFGRRRHRGRFPCQMARQDLRATSLLRQHVGWVLCRETDYGRRAVEGVDRFKVVNHQGFGRG